MTLPIESFNQMVAQQQAAMQSVSLQPLNFAVGSAINALIESNAGLGLFLQAVATKLYSASRLSTSEDNEVDTFINDYNFYRFLGSASSGSVTFSRTVTNLEAIIPIGTKLSVGGTPGLTFYVDVPPVPADYPAYDADLNVYVIPISNSAALAFVRCAVNGETGNVAAGAIDTIFGSIVGLGTVTNASAFTDGVARWDDEKTKQEFVLYIQSLARAVKLAIAFIVSTTPGVVRYNLVENYNGATPQLGFFTIVIDGGDGMASSPLLATVHDRVELYRGLTIQYSVVGPTPITANVELTLTLIDDSTAAQTQATAKVEAAITAFIATLGFQETLFITRLAQLAYDADSNISNVSIIEINGGTSNLLAPDYDNVIIVGTVTVNFA